MLNVMRVTMKCSVCAVRVRRGERPFGMSLLKKEEGNGGAWSQLVIIPGSSELNAYIHTEMCTYLGIA